MAPSLKVKKNKSDTLGARIKKHRALIPFVVPAIAFAIVFCYLPMIGIMIAFKEEPNFAKYGVLKAFMMSDWTLEHFKILFSDPEIMRYIRNTLIISVMKIVILFPMPVILAVLVSEVRSNGFSKLVQGIVFLPHFFSWVVIVGIFNSLFGIYGPVNNISVALFGGDPVHFMAEPGLFRWLVVLLSGWKEIGYSSIVYIAAITSIDPSLYESARLEGASKLRQMWSITVPLIMPTIMTMLIIRIGYLMDAGFEQVQAMITTATRESGEIIGTYVYRLMSGGDQYGLSTAVGLVNGVIALLLILAANKLSKKTMGTGIW